MAYSCINYAVLLWPIYEIETHNIRGSFPTLYIIFYVFALLITPVALAFAFKVIRTRKIFQKHFPHPTGKPWDYVFGRRTSHWIIVTLKDGSRHGGKYLGQSFASSSPNPEQIYIEEAWLINDDGGFERERVDTEGILILSDEIVTMEFFKIS